MGARARGMRPFRFVNLWVEAKTGTRWSRPVVCRSGREEGGPDLWCVGVISTSYPAVLATAVHHWLCPLEVQLLERLEFGVEVKTCLGQGVVEAGPVPGADLEVTAVQGYEVKAAPESEASLELKEGLESAADLESKEGRESGVAGFRAGRESEVAGFWASRESVANLESKEGLESGVVGFWAGRGSGAMVAAELILIGPAGRYMLPRARQ
ncbi:hypothetical protein DKX38_028466 [Salix brachista]|uniref:Uncharacterized protein n=1 Tax=Salix brachista TaxID=2182728 RepID=A0A5N5J973_9ROSI|nr:hypothetical protein DKX38_028466 [Salix brachista]